MVNKWIPISKWMLMVGVLILISEPAWAESTLTQLIPGNLDRQQLAITVRWVGTPKSQQFWVNVKHKPSVPYHFLHPVEGCLIDGPFANGTEGRRLPYHVTVIEQGKGAAIYQFTLPNHYLSNTRFQFGYTGYDTGPPMPVGDFYWFTVSDFVHQKAVVRTPSKGSPRRSVAAPLPDSFYFRKLPPLKVQHQGQTDDFNPHQVACTEVELCRQGHVKQALFRFSYPSNAEDPRVAEAFGELLFTTAPRLQKYRHQPLYLLFLGMIDGIHLGFETLTVWYYALSDAQGHILKGSPLITVHRGKAFPECGMAEVGTDMVSRKPIQLPPQLLRPH